MTAIGSIGQRKRTLRGASATQNKNPLALPPGGFALDGDLSAWRGGLRRPLRLLEDRCDCLNR
jgi:hypothetical protein